MKPRSKESMAIWLIRALWPILAGLWGAWLGAGGYSRINFTGDSFAQIFVGGYFALFALIGLAIGVLTGALVGGGTEWLLRRLGLGSIPALLGASLVCFWVCLTLSNAVQMRYPGIQTPATKKTDLPHHADVRPPPMTSNPCLDKPPADPQQRRAWEAECR
jgi:hypothetical protein